MVVSPGGAIVAIVMGKVAGNITLRASRPNRPSNVSHKGMAQLIVNSALLFKLWQLYRQLL